MVKPWVMRSLCFCLCLVLGASLIAADQDAEKDRSRKDLDLKDLIPDKSPFGPSARGMKFSHEGRYAAWLYHPYKERRHGYDLYLFDVETQEVRRVTMASVMADFQESARKVVEDRKKKAQAVLKERREKAEPRQEARPTWSDIKAALKERWQEAVRTSSRKTQEQEDRQENKQDHKYDRERDRDQEDKGKQEQEEKQGVPGPPCETDGGKEKQQEQDERIDKHGRKDQEQKKDQQGEKQQEDRQNGDGKEEQQQDEERRRMERGDWVSDKDADDEKAPRYSGVESFTWSPVAQELLFISEGDIYHYAVADGAIRRLTRTRARESAVEWWPDGSGYHFRRDGALMRVLFGSDMERQLDPKFPQDDSLATYEVSPDGRTIAFITQKQTKPPQSSKVEIASYRDRLMKAREVSRQVSDDPLGEYDLRVYLYRLSDKPDEQDKLIEVFVGKKVLPDDDVRALTWSPDSQRLAFMVFEQDSALVTIYQSRLDGPNERGKPVDAEKKDAEAQEDDGDKDDAKSPDPNETSKESDEAERLKARAIFRFYHHGGPNTPRLMTLYYLADNHHLVYLSEQTGFRHLHVLDPLYESTRALTRGTFEVYPVEISKDRAWVFVLATKEDPACLDVYKVSTRNGRMIRLSRERGVHTDPAVSPDGTTLLCNRASYETLRELVFIDAGDKEASPRELTESHPDEARTFAEPKPEFFEYRNRHGHRICGMGFKPDDWSPKDRRPCLIYFYGGPLGTRKQVVEASYSEYVYAFPYYMAKKHGYVAVAIDPRGNSGYAGVFEKANYGRVGQPQVEDIVDGADFLVAHWGVDPERVAIHGWSFGGFQTQMCMYTEPDVFAAGIAGAGPTEWENYNSWYTHHTIGKSEPGQATLKEFSLLPLAKNLKGHLLLVHGMEDDNVLYQDTIKIYRELLKAGKETLVELFLDPSGGHGLGGDVKKLARYRKYEQFLLRTIGRYEPERPESQDTKAASKPKDTP